MKKFITFATLSTKLLMLLCVSCMGFFSMLDTIQAETKMPCHQQVEISDTADEMPCEMCETALESWDSDGLVVVESLGDDTEELVKGVILIPAFIVEVITVIETYTLYYPPPEVLVKAVTPITKTIVLLS